MNPEEIPFVETWGRRLGREAQQLMSKRMPDLQWPRELYPLLEKVTSLPAPAKDRFKRVEAAGFHQPKRSLNKPNIEGEPLPLPPVIRERLAPPGSRLEGVRIHMGSEADEIAREYKADAVTIDKDIYFRQDRYRPQERVGLALLAHELEHILAALTPNAAWRRATMSGIRDEEEQALSRERQILGAHKSLNGQEMPEWNQPITSAKPVGTPLQQPMTAEVDRNISTQMSASAGDSMNMDTLRRELYRDLLSQIRSDLERGA